MALVKEPLKTVYDGKIENLRLHIQDFTRRIQNTGFYKEFIIKTQENPRPNDIDPDNGFSITLFIGKPIFFWNISTELRLLILSKRKSELMIF
jgi:hypothetical protein